MRHEVSEIIAVPRIAFFYRYELPISLIFILLARYEKLPFAQEHKVVPVPQFGQTLDTCFRTDEAKVQGCSQWQSPCYRSRQSCE